MMIIVNDIDAMPNRIPLFWRNLFFAVLQPGVVVGLIPFLIVWYDGFNFSSSRITNGLLVISTSIFMIGLIIMVSCIIRFATHGRGTISPADPTKVLVLSGLYKYSRNPMYVGVLLMLVAEGMIASNAHLWSYIMGFILVISMFVRQHEEPRLRRDFGETYVNYCNKVRRWF